MRFLIQRVREASVTVNDRMISHTDQGFLVFVGISHSDTIEIADKMIKKLIGLRIFEDQNGKTNLDLKTISGGLLLVSQFTLYADCRKGNRPSFTNAGSPDQAEKIYDHIVAECHSMISDVQTGIFGADMKIDICNDGPFTIWLDSDELGIH